MTPASSDIDPSTLTSFQHAAAGHEGPLSDPSGALFIKPCTQTEITFYENAIASHPALEAFLPTFLGTLSLQQQADSQVSSAAAVAGAAPIATTAAQTNGLVAALTPPSQVLGALKGKKLNTDVHLVLRNIAASFTKANVLDLKLGARLWDDDSAPEKRARLDAVSNATTSGSLGFRIAGMRTWQGPVAGHLGAGAAQAASTGFGELEKQTNMFSYNKLFGRQYKNREVIEGFRHFVLLPEAGIQTEHALGLLDALLDGTKQLERVLLTTELRMYSASILYTYEGDGKVFDQKYKASQAAAEEAITTTTGNKKIVVAEVENSAHVDDQLEQGDEDDEEDEEQDEEDDANTVLSIKLIDFAHARFVPGEGPDHNILQGVRSIIEILEALQQDLSK